MFPPFIKTAAVCAVICVIAPLSYADEAGPAPSFGDADAYAVVEKSVESLTAWAQGEYAEHDFEGLFTRQPKDGSVIKATISLANEFRLLAKQARLNGDTVKADAYLFSAEATARYAAQMPHLLEQRLSSK